MEEKKWARPDQHVNILFRHFDFFTRTDLNSELIIRTAKRTTTTTIAHFIHKAEHLQKHHAILTHHHHV